VLTRLAGVLRQWPFLPPGNVEICLKILSRAPGNVARAAGGVGRHQVESKEGFMVGCIKFLLTELDLITFLQPVDS